MKLQNKHLQIINQGIIMLECASCPQVADCQKKEKTICSEIGVWIKEQENLIEGAN